MLVSMETQDYFTNIDRFFHPIVLVLDDNYDDIASFYIFRLVEELSRSSRENFSIYIVTFENCVLENVLRVCKSLQISYNVIKVSNDDILFKDFKNRGHISRVAFLKLVLPNILPRTIDTCLYSDTDILVLGNIEEILSFPLGTDVLIAANLHENMKRDEFPPQDCFDNRNFSFHSGLMYINLRLARKLNFASYCLKVLEVNHKFGYADNEILVLALRERRLIQQVPARLHLVSDPVCIQNLGQDFPILVHLEGAGKPWNWPFGDQFRRQWRKQYRVWDSSFKLPLSSYLRFFKSKIKSGLYKCTFPIYSFLRSK